MPGHSTLVMPDVLLAGIYSRQVPTKSILACPRALRRAGRRSPVMDPLPPLAIVTEIGYVRSASMESRIARIALFIMLVAAAIWLGGINVRAAIGFDLLQPGTLEFKPNIHPYVERAVFGLIAQSSALVNTAYVIVWVSGILFLRTTAYRLREHGWLMAGAILFYIFTPVEVYTMVLDTKIWWLNHVGSNDLVEYRKLFIHRLGALAGVPMIALLSYYTVIGLAVFRPLRRSLKTA